MGWHGDAPFQRFGESASNSVFGLCDFGMRLLVARARQTRFARWTFPSDNDNQMKMSLPELCRFSDAGSDEPCARSGGRRLKSAKARNRGKWGAPSVPRARGGFS